MTLKIPPCIIGTSNPEKQQSLCEAHVADYLFQHSRASIELPLAESKINKYYGNHGALVFQALLWHYETLSYFYSRCTRHHGPNPVQRRTDFVSLAISRDLGIDPALANDLPTKYRGGFTSYIVCAKLEEQETNVYRADFTVTDNQLKRRGFLFIE